jgi:predicted nuclease of predicted toxin-antitoxin system
MRHNDLIFLVDVGVGKKVEGWLQEHGYDVKCVRNINPRMSDEEILKIAISEKRLVITMDKDFGELVYNSGLPHAGVLLLRLESANSEEKVEIVSNIVEKYSDKLINCFSVYKDGKLRIRK